MIENDCGLAEGLPVSQAILKSLLSPCPLRITMVDEPVDVGEVLRYLGYPAGVDPHPRLQGLLDDWVTEAARSATPKATYLVLPIVEQHPRKLRLRSRTGIVEFAGAIGEFLGPALCVAPFIATAGAAVDAMVSRLMREGETLPALIVGAVGAERAEAAEAAVIEQLRRAAEPIHFATTLPYSPGYCGMSVTQQRPLFSLFDGVDVGVTLTSDCLMRPLKSVSGLIGLGPADRIRKEGSPCDRCELYSCAMRR